MASGAVIEWQVGFAAPALAAVHLPHYLVRADLPEWNSQLEGAALGSGLSGVTDWVALGNAMVRQPAGALYKLNPVSGDRTESSAPTERRDISLGGVAKES